MRAGIKKLGEWLTSSLALRLVLASALWAAIALAAFGWLLTELYRASLIRSFDERIIVYEKTLAGIVASAPEGNMPDPGTMGDPRFGRYQSGWYWLVIDAKTQATIATSQSLFGEVLTLPPPPANGVVVTDDARDPSGTALRHAKQRIFLSSGRMYDLHVTGNVAELADEISTFRFQVFATLAAFALGLVAAAALQVSFGLRPLAAMSRRLADIREGRASRLEGRLPREIAVLGKELNALIDTNSAIVERSRTQVGNLAHALKTPLAVMLNEARAEGGPLADKVVEQVTVMRSEIDRYLDRARLAADRKVVGAVADVRRSLEGLIRVLSRAYPDRSLFLDAAAGAQPKARIERRDLEELIGNLMDNACKYGREQVLIALSVDDADRDRPMVEIRVEDDGPGLPPTAYAEVLGRGKRLDETQPGSGFGLAIAAEIAETYGGSLVLGRAGLGGLAVTFRIPQS
jgi:signal transduction histidine kinase